MFTSEDNDVLTRVSPGTPMGQLLRRYWLPAFLSEELPEPDCPPIRTRLLGEDLVGFRDSNGRVGLLAEYCSHRQASLFFGRNEDCGLRCVYHGWKYDVEGNVVETPSEPPESQLKRGIHHVAYPCVEVNRLVLVYMGPPDKKPLIPALPWFRLPAEQVCVGCKFFLECNWLQSLEGDLDSIHTSYLHRRERGGFQRRRPRVGYVKDVEVDWLPYGVRGAQIFPTTEAEYVQVQTNTYFAPCIGTIGDGNHVVYQVPADDYSCWRYDIILSSDGPISDEYVTDYREESWPASAGGSFGWQRKMTRDNNYLIDRDRQKSGEIFSGVDARNHTQDAMVTENMSPRIGPGSIVDRSRRNLGVSDRLLVGMHQFLLKATRDVQAGADAPGVAFTAKDNVFPGARGVSTDVKVGQNWRELLPA